MYILQDDLELDPVKICVVNDTQSFGQISLSIFLFAQKLAYCWIAENMYLHGFNPKSSCNM